MNIMQDPGETIARFPKKGKMNGADKEPPPISGVWFDGDQPPEPVPTIVDDMIPARGITFLGGQSGAGKTFIAIDLGVALCIKGEFFGRNTEERLGVIYVAAEGRDTISARLAAAKIGRGVERKIAFAVVNDIPDLTDTKERRGFIQKLKAIAGQLQEQFCVRVGVVIVDTIAAAFTIRDENSAAEMNQVCKSAAELGDAIGAATLVLAHYGKDPATGIRGSSATRGAGESVIAAMADRDEIKGEVKNRRLVHVKNRAGPEGAAYPFDLEGVHLGVDDKGRPFGAAKVVAKDGAVEAGERRISRGERAYLDAFALKMEDARPARPYGNGGPEVMAVDREAIRNEFYLCWPADGDTQEKKTAVRRQAFNRAETALLARRKIASREVGHRQLVWSLDDAAE